MGFQYDEVIVSQFAEEDGRALGLEVVNDGFQSDDSCMN